MNIFHVSVHSIRYFLDIFFFKEFIYLFSEREGGREKERERNTHAPNGDLAHKPGMCPGRDSNCRLSSQRLALSPPSRTRQGTSQMLIDDQIFYKQEDAF